MCYEHIRRLALQSEAQLPCVATNLVGGFELLGAETFLGPRITVGVIAGPLPEAALVRREDLYARHPLGAFPGVEMRHHEP